MKQKPRWTLEMLIAALAVLCALLTLALLVQRPAGWPALAVLAGPDLVSRGFVYVRENESLMDGAQSIVENALDRCVEEHVRDWNSVKTRVREALSSYIYRRTKRSPMILPILMEV